MKKVFDVTVFGWKIPVFKVPGLWKQTEMAGYYDEQTKRIALDADLPESEVVKTLMHEIGHVVFERLYFTSQLPDEFVEIIIENLTVAISENFEVKRKK